MGWILALLAGGFLTFNAVVTPDKAAGVAADALKKRFPGANVKVVIEGKRGRDVLNGRFKRVDVELADLTLSDLPIATSANVTPSANVTQASGRCVLLPLPLRRRLCGPIWPRRAPVGPRQWRAADRPDR